MQKFTVRGDNINTCEIEWHEGMNTIPTDIEAKMNEMANEPMSI